MKKPPSNAAGAALLKKANGTSHSKASAFLHSIARPAANRTASVRDFCEAYAVTQAIGPWLKEPNPAFDGSTPVQVIERGETDRIWRMIYELQSGEPG